MCFLSDEEIAERCQGPTPMISPFLPDQVRFSNDDGLSKLISFGVSSYGYDIRTGRDFKVFTNVFNTIVDPKRQDPRCFVDVYDVDDIIIPPNSFALCASMETLIIPRDILVVCIGKSTYARCGIIVNVTPLEPEWRGQITLEISNTTPLPARIYANEGICQLLFGLGHRVCKTSYADRVGKYQDQQGIVPARV